MQPGPIAVAEHFAMVTSHQVYVGFGQALTGVDFGSHVLPGEIHGTVFNDLDGDGQRELVIRAGNGEPGVGVLRAVYHLVLDEPEPRLERVWHTRFAVDCP